ncbi:histidinol-phosphatase [Clostridia bacterium]|nr:histidinol-phosphatase [Clostridia bacterium]
MKLYYDLHIHSCLSPCGNADMTPNNIVNMAAIKELDVIAVTDHNTAGNAEAAIIAAKNAGLDIIVLPGVEAETSEEIHVVCLFDDCGAAMRFSDFLRERLPKIKNRPDIFGEQLFMDENDEITGREETMLLTATTIDLYEMVKTVKEMGGVAFPAHIDRSSYSVLSSLGFIPPDLDINLVEVSKNADPVQFLFDNKRVVGRKFRHIQSSDAHYLEDISERNLWLEIEGEKTAENVINHLRGTRY